MPALRCSKAFFFLGVVVMNLSIESERKDVRDQQPSPTVYEAPVLRALGDIRELTLGGSLGTGDSGNALIQQV